MTAATAKRINFVKVEQAHDYVEARYDVMYTNPSGRVVKIGQVTKNSESGGRHAGGARYYTSTFTKTVWTIESVEGKTVDGYMPADHDARVDAAVAILVKKGMSHESARTAAGKRGI